MHDGATEYSADGRSQGSGEQLEPFPRFRRRLDSVLRGAAHVEELKAALNDAAARRMFLRIDCIQRHLDGQPATHATQELLVVEEMIDTLVEAIRARTAVR